MCIPVIASIEEVHYTEFPNFLDHDLSLSHGRWSLSIFQVCQYVNHGTKDIITLRGLTAIVSEFFGYAANSILHNRGIYPEESFGKVKKYGLPMLLTQDEGVKSFISKLTAQLSEWLEIGKLKRVVLVIMSKATGEVLERFSREKSDNEIMREIQAIMRQIASSITYLPCLDEPCVFDVLVYTDKDVAAPFTWIVSDKEAILATFT
ncbi:unnamed protein product [Fraxinus pennsylvanica]|uniref:HORMA domain-containing protein n=1 Tax=Fraxinus pennsylvanica TaxID=56036 RepID=A0AAD1ZUU5_9LAMI|nr:unnamed protein product [Fraxinus pennsylvanica]